jgi:hypothetical protein
MPLPNVTTSIESVLIQLSGEDAKPSYTSKEKEAIFSKIPKEGASMMRSYQVNGRWTTDTITIWRVGDGRIKYKIFV